MTTTTLPETRAPQPEAAPTRRRITRKTWQTIVWFVVLTSIALVVLYPLVWLLFSTFKPNSEFGVNRSLIPNNPTIANYIKVADGIAGVPMWRFFVNSFILAASAVVGVVASSPR
jgi:multiple sugar transport system permease protein